jgi:uncharacterized protein
MKCPNCNEELVMSERQGVEIDYCPHCRGVWLDKGELDKIIERSAAYLKEDEYRKDDSYYKGDKDYDRPPGGHHDPDYRHKKKKGFLSDFFDFD